MLLGALAQVLVALGNLCRCSGHTLGVLTYVAGDVVEVVSHFGGGLQPLRSLVLAVDIQLDGQVAGGYATRDLDRLTDRANDAAAEQFAADKTRPEDPTISTTLTRTAR